MIQLSKKIIIISLFTGLIVLFGFVFPGRLILPQSFSIGPITIHYYGLVMGAAVLAAFWLALGRANAFGLSRQQAEDILFWILIAGFVGARLYHVLSSFEYYSHHLAESMQVWKGGLSIYGALGGGLIGMYILAKRYTLSAIFLLDWLTPAVLLGQIIGRLGNLINYEAFGYPTNLPWKMFVPLEFRPAEFFSAQFFHPWFLYEMLLNICILAGLVFLERRKNLPAGGLFLGYLLLYNVGRFLLEFLRSDSTFLAGFRLNALVSLVLILVAGFCFFKVLRHGKVS